MFSRTRLCIDVLAAFASAAILVVTLVEPRWFELLFEAAPDDGDGGLESLIAALALIAATAFFLRRGLREWRRRPAIAAPEA